MKSLLMTISLAPVLLLAAVTATPQATVPAPSQGVAVRNPFWPIGYEGKRETISSEIRIVPKKPEQIRQEQAQESASLKVRAAAAEAEKKAKAEAAARERIVTPEQWTAAYKSLRIGGRVKALVDDGREASSIMINGKVYGDGDLVSFTHGKNRFTWRVTKLVDGKTVRLDRVAARHLGDVAEKNNSKKADGSAKGVSK